MYHFLVRPSVCLCDGHLHFLPLTVSKESRRRRRRKRRSWRRRLFECLFFFSPIFFFIAFAGSSTAQEVNFIKSCGLTAFSREDSRRDVTIHATWHGESSHVTWGITPRDRGTYATWSRYLHHVISVLTPRDLGTYTTWSRYLRHMISVPTPRDIDTFAMRLQNLQVTLLRHVCGLWSHPRTTFHRSCIRPC